MNMEDFPAHYEEMKDYLKQEKKKAESLLNGIKKRSDTLLHLTKAIVAHQLPFFTEGKPLQTLTMKTIAGALSMHESTISRCVASKSMIFQNQTIPLKYFFVHSLSNDSVKEVQELSLIHILWRHFDIDRYWFYHLTDTGIKTTLTKE